MNKNLHPLMLAGTGSDVGKSIIAAAFCRIFLQDGYHPAPFKAQNMALNSYATPEGLEIGRAQAVQAEAAGVPCHTDMNPLLLKPSSDHTSQVVLNGRPIGNRNAYEYFRREGREELRKEVHAAFDRLAARYGESAHGHACRGRCDSRGRYRPWRSVCQCLRFGDAASAGRAEAYQGDID